MYIDMNVVDSLKHHESTIACIKEEMKERNNCAIMFPMCF